MRLDEVIIKPIVTERSSKAMDRNILIFKVHRNATKIDIASAVEKMMGNKVESVRTLHVLGKKKRVLKSRHEIVLSSWKKAFVKIVKEKEKKLPEIKLPLKKKMKKDSK
jgi:large subunit ribosomal protein L23